MDQAELVEQFSGLTSTSSTEALNWLEMAGFELQAALDLFFNAAGGEEVVTQPAHRKETHEERFDYDEDEVRMPDEVKRQKLVDTDVYLGSGGQSLHNDQALSSITVYCVSQRIKSVERLPPRLRQGARRL